MKIVFFLILKMAKIFQNVFSILAFKPNSRALFFVFFLGLVNFFSAQSKENVPEFHFSESGHFRGTSNFENFNDKDIFSITIPNPSDFTVHTDDGMAIKATGGIDTTWVPNIWTDFKTDKANSILYDYSYAGYKSGDESIPDVALKASITDFGAIPNDTIDDTQALQDAVDYVNSIGGGAVDIPVGKFLLGAGATIKFVKIPENVVIRGNGNREDGSVFFITNLLCEESTCSSGQAAIITQNEKFVIYPSKTVTATAAKGTNILSLNNTSGLKAGDAGRIRMYNPNVDGTRTNELSLLLTSPLEPESEWYNFTKYAPFECAFEIEQVINSTTVKLKQPLMQEISVGWSPRFELLDFVEGVGIENLRIESAFSGGYSHHKNWEVDYGWTAIEFNNTRNSWIRNVVIDDLTQDINLSNSMNITVEDIIVEGEYGHHGIKANNSWFNLVRNCRVKTFRTHPVGVAGMAHGNVFTNIVIDHLNGMIDFHGGGFSSNNLFERMNNSHVDGAGAIQNMPHSGQFNTFWNIAGNASASGKPGFDFFSGFWNYPSIRKERSGGQFSYECYKLYPKSIMVGVYHPDINITVNKSASDRDDVWLYNEGFNKPNVSPSSLYEAQKQLRGAILGHTDKALLKEKTKSGIIYQMADKLYFKRDIENGLVAIHDISGKRVGHYAGRIYKDNTVPVRLKPGIYFISVIQNNESFVHKFIFK